MEVRIAVGSDCALSLIQPRLPSSVAQREVTQVTGRQDHFQCCNDASLENPASFL